MGIHVQRVLRRQLEARAVVQAVQFAQGREKIDRRFGVAHDVCKPDFNGVSGDVEHDREVGVGHVKVLDEVHGTHAVAIVGRGNGQIRGLAVGLLKAQMQVRDLVPSDVVVDVADIRVADHGIPAHQDQIEGGKIPVGVEDRGLYRLQFVHVLLFPADGMHLPQRSEDIGIRIVADDVERVRDARQMLVDKALHGFKPVVDVPLAGLAVDRIDVDVRGDAHQHHAQQDGHGKQSGPLPQGAGLPPLAQRMEHLPHCGPPGT